LIEAHKDPLLATEEVLLAIAKSGVRTCLREVEWVDVPVSTGNASEGITCLGKGNCVLAVREPRDLDLHHFRERVKVPGTS
jgi:hypothetical protein